MNLECSSRGDKRFSAFYAKLKKYGNQSIETLYQNSKRTEDGSIPGKGKKVAYVIWDNKKYPPTVLTKLYEKLWRQYFIENPELLEYAKQFDTFTDMFRGKAVNCQADIIAKIVKETKNIKHYLLIAGGRDFSNYQLLKDNIKHPENIEYIISGCASGADTLAIQYANEMNIPVLKYPAQWDKYGKKAGYIRNKQMVEKATCVICFWDNQSRGTKLTIDLAKEYNRPLKIVNY